jgi:hypothetical protein
MVRGRLKSGVSVDGGGASSEEVEEQESWDGLSSGVDSDLSALRGSLEIATCST